MDGILERIQRGFPKKKTPRGISEVIPGGNPEEIHEKSLQGFVRETPEGIPGGISEGILGGIFEEVLGRIHERTPGEIHEGISGGVPEGIL